jgi:hypothetical protein
MAFGTLGFAGIHYFSEEQNYSVEVITGSVGLLQCYCSFMTVRHVEDA